MRWGETFDEGGALGAFFDDPLESHLRGVVGHAAFGLPVGGLLSLIDRSR